MPIVDTQIKQIRLRGRLFFRNYSMCSLNLTKVFAMAFGAQDSSLFTSFEGV
jgi:hypothetical protein